MGVVAVGVVAVGAGVSAGACTLVGGDGGGTRSRAESRGGAVGASSRAASSTGVAGSTLSTVLASWIAGAWGAGSRGAV